MNTRQQGDLAVADAIAYYTNKGYIISFPMTEAARYDLIIDKTKLLRVQCKCTGQVAPSGWFKCELRTRGGNQSWNKKESKKLSAQECDIVFIRTMSGDRYAIPIHVIEGRSIITLGTNYQQYRLGA